MKKVPLRILGVILLTTSACAHIAERTREVSFQVMWVASNSEEPKRGPRFFHRVTPALAPHRSLVLFTAPFSPLKAMDMESGHLLWSYPLKEGSACSPLIEGDFAFVGGLDGNIYAFDLEKGNLLWVTPTRAEIQSELVISRGILIAQTSHNVVFGIEAASGKILWSYTRPELPHLSVRGGAKPLILNDKVFCAFSDGAVVALKLSSGQLIWENHLVKFARLRDLDLDVSLWKEEEDQLFVVGVEDKAYWLDLKTGQVVQTEEMMGWGRLFESKSSEDRCLNHSLGGVFCWDRKSRVWKKVQALGDRMFAPGKFLSSSLLLIGHLDGELLVWDNHFQLKVGSFFSGRGFTSHAEILPTSKGWKVYIVSREGYLYALEVTQN